MKKEKDIEEVKMKYQKEEEDEKGDDNCDIQYFQQGCTGNQNLNKPIENAITIEYKKNSYNP